MFEKPVIFLLIVAVAVQAENPPEVKIAEGVVQGQLAATVSGRKFFSFEGVPYAKPPVGSLRFQEPEPIQPWTGKWISKIPNFCLQYEHAAGGEPYTVVGSEDCLYLNVYTPTKDAKANLDVIVYIHGGALMFGSSSMYRPDNLLDLNVILVTINYRLGPLGFLTFEDAVVPGNNGMKDQVLALKWVQRNIQYFGGNPKSVTISGCSAGGASVHAHYLSPLSKGLFQRGYSMSGATLNPWPFMEAGREKSLRVAEAVGCKPTATSQEILECLRQRPGKQIVQTVELFLGWLYNPFSPFGMVVDKHATTPFMPQSPRKLLEAGKVQDLPWIVAVTRDEGLYPAAEFMESVHFLDEIEKRWLELAPLILDYNYTVKATEKDRVSEAIKLHYLRGQPINGRTFPKLVDMMSDRLFKTGIFDAAKLQSKVTKSPVYFYRYNFRGKHSLSEKYSGKADDYGVSHADDTLQVFDFDNVEDLPIRRVLLELFRSFAESGRPNVVGVDWKPVCDKKDVLTFLDINGPEDLKLGTTDDLGERQFWATLGIQD